MRQFIFVSTALLCSLSLSHSSSHSSVCAGIEDFTVCKSKKCIWQKGQAVDGVFQKGHCMKPPCNTKTKQRQCVVAGCTWVRTADPPECVEFRDPICSDYHIGSLCRKNGCTYESGKCRDPVCSELSAKKCLDAGCTWGCVAAGTCKGTDKVCRDAPPAPEAPAAVCTCPSGTAVTGAACPSEGFHLCEAGSCDAGHTYKNGKCEKNVCSCALGPDPTGVDCPVDGKDYCVTCDAGAYLNVKERVCKKADLTCLRKMYDSLQTEDLTVTWVEGLDGSGAPTGHISVKNLGLEACRPSDCDGIAWTVKEEFVACPNGCPKNTDHCCKEQTKCQESDCEGDLFKLKEYDIYCPTGTCEKQTKHCCELLERFECGDRYILAEWPCDHGWERWLADMKYCNAPGLRFNGPCTTLGHICGLDRDLNNCHDHDVYYVKGCTFGQGGIENGEGARNEGPVSRDEECSSMCEHRNDCFFWMREMPSGDCITFSKGDVGLSSETQEWHEARRHGPRCQMTQCTPDRCNWKYLPKPGVHYCRGTECPYNTDTCCVESPKCMPSDCDDDDWELKTETVYCTSGECEKNTNQCCNSLTALAQEETYVDRAWPVLETASGSCMKYTEGSRYKTIWCNYPFDRRIAAPRFEADLDAELAEARLFQGPFGIPDGDVWTFKAGTAGSSVPGTYYALLPFRNKAYRAGTFAETLPKIGFTKTDIDVTVRFQCDTGKRCVHKLRVLKLEHGGGNLVLPAAEGDDNKAIFMWKPRNDNIPGICWDSTKWHGKCDGCIDWQGDCVTSRPFSCTDCTGAVPTSEKILSGHTCSDDNKIDEKWNIETLAACEMMCKGEPKCNYFTFFPRVPFCRLFTECPIEGRYKTKTHPDSATYKLDIGLGKTCPTCPTGWVPAKEQSPQNCVDAECSGTDPACCIREGPTTCGGNAPEGAKCTFPFVYNEVHYDECTDVDHDEMWCYTDQKTLQWGNCDCGRAKDKLVTGTIASQRSTRNDKVAALGNDGDMDTWTETNSEYNPWFQLELPRPTDVTRIVLQNRKDRCWNMLFAENRCDGAIRHTKKDDDGNVKGRDTGAIFKLSNKPCTRGGCRGAVTCKVLERPRTIDQKYTVECPRTKVQYWKYVSVELRGFSRVLSIVDMRVYESTECPYEVRPAETSECPTDPDIANCLTPGLAIGSLCEAGGECYTDSNLNNCGNHDIYVVTGSVARRRLDAGVRRRFRMGGRWKPKEEEEPHPLGIDNYSTCPGLKQIHPKYEYVGCYKDDKDRDLDHYKGWGKNQADCTSLCRAFKYFSMQNGSECWCGNGYATEGKYSKTPDSECGQTRLGGPWRNAVFQHKADCWDKCGQKSGSCNWCGSGGKCCRRNWNGGEGGCHSSEGGDSFHQCVDGGVVGGKICPTCPSGWVPAKEQSPENCVDAECSGTDPACCIREDMSMAAFNAHAVTEYVVDVNPTTEFKGTLGWFATKGLTCQSGPGRCHASGIARRSWDDHFDFEQCIVDDTNGPDIKFNTGHWIIGLSRHNDQPYGFPPLEWNMRSLDTGAQGMGRFIRREQPWTEYTNRYMKSIDPASPIWRGPMVPGVALALEQEVKIIHAEC